MAMINWTNVTDLVSLGSAANTSSDGTFWVGLLFAIWLILLLTDNFWLVLMVWMVPSWSFMSISAMSMISDLTTTTERGRGIGAFNSALNLGQFIGAMVSGLVAGWLAPALPTGLAVHEFKGVWLFAVLLLIIPFFLAFKVPETLRMRLGKHKGSKEAKGKASKEEE